MVILGKRNNRGIWGLLLVTDLKKYGQGDLIKFNIILIVTSTITSLDTVLFVIFTGMKVRSTFYY